MSDVNAAKNSLQSNFQAGVDGIYDTIVAQGTTPASKSLSDVKAGINSLSTNKYNSGYNSGKTDYNPTNATLSNAGALTVTNAAGTSRLTKTFTNSYDAGVTAGTNATKKGDADVSHVLSGKTFTSATAGVNKTGTMANNGAIDIQMDDHIHYYNIPYGFHSGTGKVYPPLNGGFSGTVYTDGQETVSILVENTIQAILVIRENVAPTSVPVSGAWSYYWNGQIKRQSNYGAASLQSVSDDKMSFTISGTNNMHFKFSWYAVTVDASEQVHEGMPAEP